MIMFYQEPKHKIYITRSGKWYEFGLLLSSSLA